MQPRLGLPWAVFAGSRGMYRGSLTHPAVGAACTLGLHAIASAPSCLPRGARSRPSIANVGTLRHAVARLAFFGPHSLARSPRVCSPDGLKKAYVRLTTDYDALDVANKIGII